MVLSGSKKTTHLASIVNQDTGGGSKKAGLPHQIGREASVSVAFRNTSSNLFFLQGPKSLLKNILKIATYYLTKAQAAKTAADALVASKITLADALDNVTVTSDDTNTAIQGKIDTLAAIDPQTQAETDAIAALQAIIDARADAAPHVGLVAAEQTKVDAAQAKLDAYTADI
ncbi:MAG: hypothetical protein ACO3UU_14640 [Minisyncoccia bacterium]